VAVHIEYGIMNLGDLQLGDGERSWPQRRRGGSDNYERAGGVPLTLSDFNVCQCVYLIACLPLSAHR